MDMLPSYCRREQEATGKGGGAGGDAAVECGVPGEASQRRPTVHQIQVGDQLLGAQVRVAIEGAD